MRDGMRGPRQGAAAQAGKTGKASVRGARSASSIKRQGFVCVCVCVCVRVEGGGEGSRAQGRAWE